MKSLFASLVASAFLLTGVAAATTPRPVTRPTYLLPSAVPSSARFSPLPHRSPRPTPKPTHTPWPHRSPGLHHIPTPKP